MAARIFLGISALIWVPFGVYCLFVPGFLAEAAGVSFATPTGATDMRATYGGLTLVVGGFALMGALRTPCRGNGLLMLAAACTGLGGARLIGLALDGGFSAWTGQALALELTTAAIGWWLQLRHA
jgi:hypothetical protein